MSSQVLVSALRSEFNSHLGNGMVGIVKDHTHKRGSAGPKVILLVMNQQSLRPILWSPSSDQVVDRELCGQRAAGLGHLELFMTVFLRLVAWEEPGPRRAVPVVPRQGATCI